ncbi:calcium-binding protein [Burkholderia gladioli]|uniref:calcium-binding protein n=1 Tax=Burkholderia gladioli TaxID=28095 RepID=UPI001C222DB2|nr:calcium-binding protein [Burkholderia gladioli]MBU9172675.1 calcium-binding protein [Burkholderia gladioli]
MSGNFESKLGEDDFWGGVEAAAISYGANFSEKTAAEFRSLSRSMKNFAMELGGRAELAKSYLENLNSLSSSIYDDLSSVDRSKYSSEVLRNVDRYTASAKMSEDLLASASRMESSAFVFEQIGRHVGNTFVGLTILATLSKPGATAAEVAEVAFPLAMSMLGVALASAIAVLPALDLAIIGIGMGIAGKLAWDGLVDALGITGKNSPPFWDFLSSFFDFNKEKQVSDYAKAIAIIFGKSMTDPLVMDLSGDGIQLISESESKTYFDLHGTGFAVHTGWIGPQTGFLARENESGTVTSISDLFGNDETDGFSALAALDANRDGVVDLSDPGFYDLCVWADVNGNGVSDPGELHSLQELGIVAINLETENSKRKVGGNLVAEAATFVKSDGSTGEIVEAYFDNNPVNSKFKGNFSLNPEVLDLPNLRGYGTLTDLSVAMSVDPALLGMVEKFLKGVIDDVPDLCTRVSAIVFQWAGVSGVDPDSRGRFVDARKLEVVEKFSGQGFGAGHAGAGKENPWNYFQANAINEAFDALLSAVGARLLLQGPLKTCFEGMSFDYYSDSFIGSFDPDEAGRRLMNSMSGEVGEYGDEIAYLTRVLSVGLGGGFDEFIPVFQYVFRELHLKYTVEEAASGHVIIEGGVLGGTATNGSISLSRDGGAYYVDGGPGVDEIYGGGGADTFIFNQGYGRLRIYENQSTDLSSGTVLKLGKGLDPSTITVTTNNGDVIIRQGTDRITLSNMADYPDHYGVSQIQFADGTVWTAEELVAKARFINGTSENDLLDGSFHGDVFDGKGGNDEIYGRGGTDTFIFNQGYGRLRIYENQSTDLSSGTVLKLGKGLDPSTVTVTTNNGDVVIRQGTDRITLSNMADYPDHYGVSQIQFADGTVWTAEELVAKARFINGTSENDLLDGSFHGDVFDGKGGNDEIYGRGGTDTFIFNQGYGRLRIYEDQSTDLSSGTVLKLGKGLDPSTITVTTNNGDVIIRQGTDRITLSNMADYPDHYGVSQIQFADGTVWTAEELVAKARFINGTSENDSLDGSFHGDVFDGKGGNDEIYGGGGADTFIFNQGYGRLRIYENQPTDLSSGTVLKLGKGLDPSTITVTTNNGDVIIRQGTDRITLSNMADYPDHYGVSQVQFADGTIWAAEQLINLARGIEARPALISLYAVSDDAFPDTMLPNARFAPIEGDNTASSHELSMENAKSDTQLNQLVDAMASYTGSNRGCVDMALSGRSIDDRSPMLATYAEK